METEPPPHNSTPPADISMSGDEPVKAPIIMMVALELSQQFRWLGRPASRPPPLPSGSLPVKLRPSIFQRPVRLLKTVIG